MVFTATSGKDLVGAILSNRRVLPNGLELGRGFVDGGTTFIVGFSTKTSKKRAYRRCTYRTKRLAIKAYHNLLELITIQRALYSPTKIGADDVILALGMVRFKKDAAWAHRFNLDRCRPLSDTLRCLNLERAQGRRVLAISKDTEGLGEQVDTANHCDEWFGAGLASSIRLDGVVVGMVVMDWNRFPPEYARQSYPKALEMIRAMRARGLLAPQGCVVYLPLLHDQTPGRLVYSGSSPFPHEWTLVGVRAEDNPLWQATTEVWPAYSVRANANFLNKQTPFARMLA